MAYTVTAEEARESLSAVYYKIMPFCDRAQEDSDVGTDDIIAVLGKVRSLQAVLEASELKLIDAARERKVPWSKLAKILGLAGKQGAAKRYEVLTRRYGQDQLASWRREYLARREAERADQAPPAEPSPEPLPAPESGPRSGAPEPWTDEGRAIANREYSATLKHRPLPDRGTDWTYTVDGDHVAVWYKKDVKAGSAERDWPGSRWIAKNGAAVRIGDSQPTRLQALKYAADSYEHARRQEAPAGKDRPLAAADGWVLRQTLADRDAGRWQVIAPDGTRAGTAQPSYRGAQTWTAVYGERVTVAPMHIPGSGPVSASHGEDWRTMTAAALAVAWYTTDGETPAPGTTAGPAQDDPDSGTGRSPWTVTEPLPGADGWQLARTQRDADDGRWQVLAPDGTVTGYVAQNATTATGGRAWEAVSGDLREDSSPLARVSPGADDVHAAPDGAWSSRDLAAIAVAYAADPHGVPSPDLTAIRATTEALRSAAPKITARIIRESLFTCVKASTYETTGAWDVLVGGERAGSVRPTWRGTGGTKGWEPVDLAGTVMGVANIGRTTAGGHAATRDAAAVALLHALQRRQDQEPNQRRLTAVPGDDN